MTKFVPARPQPENMANEQTTLPGWEIPRRVLAEAVPVEDSPTFQSGDRMPPRRLARAISNKVPQEPPTAMTVLRASPSFVTITANRSGLAPSVGSFGRMPMTTPFSARHR